MQQEINAIEEDPTIYKIWTRGNIDPYLYSDNYQMFADMGEEYFLVENRQKIGFDKNLPQSGLLIWHIDNSVYNSTVNNNEHHNPTSITTIYFSHFGVSIYRRSVHGTSSLFLVRSFFWYKKVF